MKISLTVLATLIILAFSGCSRNDAINNVDSANPLKDEWILDAFESIGHPAIFLHPSDTIQAVFGDSASLTGRSRGRCGNYYIGAYEMGASSNLQIHSIISSEAGCSTSAYWKFIHALESVTRFEISGRLYLYYDGSSKRMWLRRGGSS